MSNKLHDKKIYFFHPAYAGHEPFQAIADELAEEFLAIGIDNAYMYYDIQIKDLSQLAHYYLEQLLDQPYIFHPSLKEVIFVGWSIGGNIALEMAYQLEQQGYKNIKVFLLDTGLEVSDDLSPFATLNEKDRELFIKKLFHEKVMNEEHLQHMYKVNKTIVLLRNNLSHLLFHTEIVLLKAAKKMADSFDLSEIFEFPEIRKLESQYDNNIQQICSKKIKIIEIEENHIGIIKQTTKITNIIQTWIKAPQEKAEPITPIY